MKTLRDKFLTHGRNYKNIENHFIKFKTSLSQIQDQIPSLSILDSKNISHEDIYIRFLGKTYVIRLEYDVQGDNSGTGSLVSYLVNTINVNKDMEKHNQVFIDKLGNAKTKDYEGYSPWSINDDRETILFTLLNWK